MTKFGYSYEVQKSLIVHFIFGTGPSETNMCKALQIIMEDILVVKVAFPIK